MNISPIYVDGICLRKGKYNILVTKDGFKPFKEWIELSKDLSLTVSLQLQDSSAQSVETSAKSGNVNASSPKLSDINLQDFNAEGDFLWGDAASRHLAMNRLFWQDEPVNADVGKHYTEAKKICSSLRLPVGDDEISGFRLPTRVELNELYSLKSSLNIPQRENIILLTLGVF